MPVNQAFAYVWPFVAAVLLLNIGIGHVRARALVAKGQISDEERQDFTRAAAVFSVADCGIQWGILVLSRTHDPFCLLTFPPHDIYGMASWLVAGGSVVLLLRRLWAGGAEFLARIVPAYMRGSIDRQFTPERVSLVVTALLLAAILGNIMMQLVGPNQAFVCGATRPAA